MRKRLKNCILISSIIVSAIVMTGCVEKLHISDEDRELIVEGAVNAVLNHDKNYIVKMKDRIVEEETTVWINDDGSASVTEEDTTRDAQKVENDSQEETSKPDSSENSSSDVFGVSGFKIESCGYEVKASYPEDVDGFSMVATSGNKLLVMKFKVKNTSGESSKLDMLGRKNRYRCYINDSNVITAQITALPNGLNTWSDTIGAGKSKEMVLIFQVSDDIASNINSIKLSVEREGSTYTTSITE